MDDITDAIADDIIDVIANRLASLSMPLLLMINSMRSRDMGYALSYENCICLFVR